MKIKYDIITREGIGPLSMPLKPIAREWKVAFTTLCSSAFLTHKIPLLTVTVGINIKSLQKRKALSKVA